MHDIDISRGSQIRVWRVFSTAKIRIADNEYYQGKCDVEIGRSLQVSARISLNTLEIRIALVSVSLSGSEGIVKVEARGLNMEYLTFPC